MIDTAPSVDQKPKLSPLDQKFELANQSISERRNSLLTLLEITHWISLMEEVTKKTKDRNVLIAAIARVSNLLESQRELHQSLDETRKVYKDGLEVDETVTGENKFDQLVTDLSLDQPLITTVRRHEKRSRSLVLEEYQTRLLEQLIQLPGSKESPFENIDKTVDLLSPITHVDRLEKLPDGYGKFYREGLLALYSIGTESQRLDVVDQCIDRISIVMSNKNLLALSNTYFKTKGVSRLFGRKQEKHFPYIIDPKETAYNVEQRKLWLWLDEFYLQPLKDRKRKMLGK